MESGTAYNPACGPNCCKTESPEQLPQKGRAPSHPRPARPQRWDLIKASKKGIFATTRLYEETVPTAEAQRGTTVASSHPELFWIYTHFMLCLSSSGNLPFAFP